MRKEDGHVSPTVGARNTGALEVEAGSLHCPKVGEDPPCVRQASSIPSNNPLHDSVSKQDTTQEPVSQNHHLLSYVKWMSTLVPSVLRTRTPFSAFLSKSIQLSYGAASGPIAPTFFPVPIPEGYCHVMPAGVSSSRRRAVHLSRTLHTVVMALNFWHSGGSFPDDASLQRAPNSLHRVLYRRIRSLLKSDGPALAFETTKAGRRFPELYARLGELSEVLTANGVSSNPYAKSFTGVEVQKDDSKMPELRPYRDLDPSRLKLSGTGHFDATPYLSDPLVLPYRDPRCLQSSLAPGVMPPLRDSQKTIGELASLWDSLGLLHLHREELDPNSYVRIFNAYKSEQADRQIGDRRGANALESRISEFGPSSRLPAGYDIAELSLDPRRESLVICITDRKDFYHQFWVSDCKAIGNSLGPKVHISHVEQCPSYAAFANRYATRNKRYDRSKHGDRLGHQPSALSDKEHCFVAFKSILQGDHCGVDIATDAHTSVLQERGLLHPDSSLIATRPLVSQNLCQGLVIDDFFAISVERDGTLPQESEAYRKYRVSQEVYQRHKLAGSPQKDILGEASGKVIGAWIDSRPSTRARGLCTVSAPPSKRLGLSHVSLSVASLSHTSDALHLCLVGGWISAMGYRRPTYSLFDSAFRLVSSSEFDPNHPRLVSLPRPVANELVLASILHPLMMTDIGAKYHDRVFATDASSKKGAVCSAPITQQMSEILWKTSKSKGSYSRLMSPAEELLHRLGIREEIEQEENGPWETDRPGRPLAYRFDFIEVYAGAAKITKAMVNLGVPVGPPIEISLSMEYDLRMPHVILWLSYLVCNRLVLSIVVEPPCTTFSIIRRPALRSKFVPLGFQPREEKTQTGNILSSRASQLVYIAGENKVAGLLETPYSSFLKYTPAFRAAANKPYARQVRVDSCRFGSPHLKSFRMLCVHFKPCHIDKQCVCTGRHLQVQGQYTKASATYTDDLARSIALDMLDFIQAERHKLLAEETPNSKGLESVLVNDVAISSDWKVETSWTFRGSSHINILEEASLLRLTQRLAKLKYPTRVTSLVDSNVVRGATSKGRSSSKGLSRVLMKLNATMVAAGLYMHTPFCPTRLNVSDDPTRDVQLRPPASGLPISSLSREDLFRLATLPKLRRWAANWCRLLLRVAGLHLIFLPCRDLYRRCHSSLEFSHSSMDFDASLGFPGEGPGFRQLLAFAAFCLLYCGLPSPFCVPLWILTPCLTSSLPSSCFACFLWSVVELPSLSPGRAMAMPIAPQTPAEMKKSLARGSRPPLAEGRPVLPTTGSLRDKYFKVFESWTREEGIDIHALLEHSHQYVEEINIVVSRFGRELFRAGKTYNQYAETINSLTSMRPSLRRQMQGAWDLGFAWMRQEPTQHHVAIPSIILIAMITTSLLWGWVRFAGCLALGWGSLLRPGEIFSLRRLNLLFPEDSGFSIQYVLVSLQEPKTRFTTARHQSTRLDAPDLVRVAWLSFGKLLPNQFVWPYSPQTFRNRFRSVLEKLMLPTTHSPGLKCLDPGSMRAGGATWLMQVTDDGELVRRRGRWQNQRIMEVYIQEVSSVLYLQQIRADAKRLVFQVAGSFFSVLERSFSLEEASIPHHVWFILFSS